jgi:hypothetical protein
VPVKVPVEVREPSPEPQNVYVERKPAPPPPAPEPLVVAKLAPAPEPRSLARPRPMKPRPAPARVEETVSPPVMPPVAPPPPAKASLGPMPDAMEVLTRTFDQRKLPSHVSEIQIFEHSGNTKRLKTTLRLARLHQKNRIMTMGLLEGYGGQASQRLLSIEAGRTDDERFTYVAETGEVERLAGDQGQNPFEGTSFSYDDFRPLQVGHFLIHQIARSVLDQQTLYILSVKPRFRRDYDRLEFVVDALDYALLETHYYRGKGLRPYRIVQFPRDSMDQLGKSLIPKRLVSRDLVNRTVREARVVNLQPAQNLSSRFFTLTQLKRPDLTIPNL